MSFGRIEKCGSGEYELELHCRCKGLSNEVRSLEDRTITFTPQKAANILDLLILRADDHGKRS